MIRVLVLAGQREPRRVLEAALSGVPGIQLIRADLEGRAALETVSTLQPNVTVVGSPRLESQDLALIRQIMETCPTRVILAAGADAARDPDSLRRSSEAGALALVALPSGAGDPAAGRLAESIRLMAEVKVVKRWPQAGKTGSPPFASRRPASRHPMEVVAIGASSGGPPVLHHLLAALPRDFPVPILIVQHITPGFTGGLAEWLGQSTGVPVEVACSGQRPCPGHVYFAPDGKHLLVREDECLHLGDAPPENGHRPAVSQLFRSVARVFGARAVGILLTGMGRDGAQELKVMREAGALTIAQDAASSVVHGMPGEAIALGAAELVLSPPEIVVTLADLAAARTRPHRTDNLP